MSPLAAPADGGPLPRGAGAPGGAGLLDPRGTAHVSLPNSPAGRTSSTSAMMTKMTTLEASG